MDDQAPRGYDGTTYYGRNQVKPAPFQNGVVGSYIFLAGLSGAAQIISAVAALAGGSRAAGAVRRGRYLALLAPILGAPLLIYDLHTPQRFYNMLRIFRPTSPMSIGTWILSAFTGFSFLTAGLQFRGSRKLATIAQVPAAAAGVGMSMYTAALLSATSTPLWAAAPRALAVRFGASSVSAGAAALALAERRAGNRRAAEDLDTLALTALAVEAVGSFVSKETYRQKGISAASAGPDMLCIAAPIALKAASGLLRSDGLSALASLAILAGSLNLRVSFMSEGDESARRPQDAFRFASNRTQLPGDRRGK